MTSNTEQYIVLVPEEAPSIPIGFSLSGYMIMAGDWITFSEYDAAELALARQKWALFGHRQNHLFCLCESTGRDEKITSIYSEWGSDGHWGPWLDFYSDEAFGAGSVQVNEVDCQQVIIPIPAAPPPAPQYFTLSHYQVFWRDDLIPSLFFRPAELALAAQHWVERGCEFHKLLCVCKTVRNRYIDDVHGQRFIIYSIWQAAGGWGEWLDYHSDEPFEFDAAAYWIHRGAEGAL